MPRLSSSSIETLAATPLTPISPEAAHAAAEAADADSTNTTPPDDSPPADDAQPSLLDPFKPSGSTILRVLLGVQKYSSYAFTGFLGLHLVSVVVTPALASVDAGNSALLFARTLYQAPGLETVLVTGALVLHVGAGAALRAYKLARSKNLYAAYLTPQLSQPSRLALAGYAATPLLLAHYYMSRALPAAVLGDSSLISLDFISHSLASHPGPAIFSVLSLLGLTLYHAVYGWRRWLRIYSRPRLISAPTAVIATGVLLGALSLAKLLARGPASGWLASQYDLVAAAAPF